jgi:hypothetical protein
MVLLENGQEHKNLCRKKADYQELAKLICRMVFPPAVLENLRNHELD